MIVATVFTCHYNIDMQLQVCYDASNRYYLRRYYMTTRLKNIIGFIFTAILLLAVAIVGAGLIFHPSADGSSTYIGGLMILVAIGIQSLLMLRGTKQ